MKTLFLTALLMPVIILAQSQENKILFPLRLDPTTTTETGNQVFTRFHRLLSDDAVCKQILALKPEKVILNIPLPEVGSVNLELEQNEIFGSVLPVYERSGQHLTEFAYTPGVYYRGSVSGYPNSIAAFSIFEDQIIAVFSFGTGNYVLGNISDDKGNPVPGQLVIYNDEDLKLPFNFECHNDDLNIANAVKPMKGLKKQLPAGNCQVEEIYFECDYEMYLDNGSSVTNVINYLTGVFNVVSAVYAIHDMKIGIQSTTVWTTDDPYSTSSSLDALFGFVDTQIQEADFHHLLSTNDNNLGGIAFVGEGLCTYQEEGLYYNYAYSNIYNTYENLPLFSWTVMVIAHENGHNLGSHHTHWCGWPSGRLDNCGPTAGYFDGEDCPNGPTPTEGTVMSYCHLIGGIGIDLTLGFGDWPGVGPTDVVTTELATNSCFINPVIGSLSASATSTVCEGNDIQLTASAMSGATIEWFGPGGFYSTSPVTVIADATPAQGGFYKAVATYLGCSTDTIYKNVTVTPAYTAPTTLSSDPGVVDIGEASLLEIESGTLSPGATWVWYAGSCGGTAIGTGTTELVNLSFTTTYYVRAEGPCGMSPCASITVLVQNFNCIADLDLNNQVDTNDLLLFLAVLGCTGNCLGDFTNDDAVNTSDLLIFLSYFGLPCP